MTDKKEENELQDMKDRKRQLTKEFNIKKKIEFNSRDWKDVSRKEKRSAEKAAKKMVRKQKMALKKPQHQRKNHVKQP